MARLRKIETRQLPLRDRAAARLRSRRVAAQSLLAHPGLSHTDLQSTTVEEGGGWAAGFFHGLARVTGMTPAQGALPQIRAATDPTARSGEFYAPRFVNNGPPVSRPILRVLGMDRAIERLFDVSERETGIALDVAAAKTSARA